jgi:mevalonate pyrophosphate decarboxylase
MARFSGWSGGAGVSAFGLAITKDYSANRKRQVAYRLLRSGQGSGTLALAERDSS